MDANRTGHRCWMPLAALVLASVAVGLSLVAVLPRSGDSGSVAARVCVDQEARTELDRLRRAIAQRDAMIDRLRRGGPASAADLPGTGVIDATSPATGAAAEPLPAGLVQPRYARLEVDNPAVTVTQAADGSFEIRSKDLSLSGAIVQLIAVTESGAEERFNVRVP